MERQPLRFWYWFLPYTFDTYKSDNISLLLMAKNIYAPLVSTFVDGVPQGMIAKDWQVDSTGKIWRFIIRPGLTFDDGTLITPGIVLANFRRILWLTRTEGLLLNSLLPEVKTWKAYPDPLASLYVEGDSLVFKLNRRPINFFETLEQPIYGIANPKCFGDDGKWNNPKCVSASGQYKVKDISPTRMVLESRHLFPEVNGAPDTVEVNIPGANYTTAIQTLLNDKGDMTIRSSQDLSAEIVKDITAKGLVIVNEPLVRMHFLQLNALRGPFKSKFLRQSFRDVFLSLLNREPKFSAETELNTSFIPKGGAGYLSFSPPQVKNAIEISGKEITVVLPIVSKTGYSRSLSIYMMVEKAVLETIKLHGFKAKIVRCSTAEWAERRGKGAFDMGFSSSGILVNNPYADLRMMFISKIGAKIPDPSGKIPKMIEQAERPEKSAQRQKILEKINLSIYEEASVITYMHSGQVYVHRNGVDLSRVNLFSDPIEFRAVQWFPVLGKD